MKTIDKEDLQTIRILLEKAIIAGKPGSDIVELMKTLSKVSSLLQD